MQFFPHLVEIKKKTDVSSKNQTEGPRKESQRKYLFQQS